MSHTHTVPDYIRPIFKNAIFTQISQHPRLAHLCTDKLTMNAVHDIITAPGKLDVYWSSNPKIRLIGTTISQDTVTPNFSSGDPDHILKLAINGAKIGNLTTLVECLKFAGEILLYDAGDDPRGYTIIHHACEHSQYDIVSYLLKSNSVEIDIKSSTGETPLIVATRATCLPIVRLLLDYGANPAASDDSGKNSLDYALASGNEQLIVLLLEYPFHRRQQSSVSNSFPPSGIPSPLLAPPLLPPGPISSTSTNTMISAPPTPIINQTPFEDTELKNIRTQISEKEKEISEIRKEILFLQEIHTCVVCSKGQSDCLLLECSHLVSCSGCAKILEQKGVCPVCSKKISRIVRTFTS